MVLVPMEWNGTTTMLPPTPAFDNWTQLHIKDLLLRIYIVRSYNTPPESKRWQHATGINASIIFTWRYHTIPYHTTGAVEKNRSLGAFTTDTTRKLNIFWHDRDALGMDSAQVRIFKEPDKISFRRLLHRQNSRPLESKVTFKVLRDFSHQALKGQFTNQELGRLLVTANFSEGNGTRSITMRFPVGWTE